jgi:hypothetical protein
MTLTAIDIFQQAAGRGLRLKVVGNALHVNPALCCPPNRGQQSFRRPSFLL